MRRFTTIDAGAAFGVLMFAALISGGGCAHKPTSADIRNCCNRVSAYSAEMDKFSRYCKVAVFLANSDNRIAVGSAVKKGARDAVNICKFVFSVKTDDELVVAGDEQAYFKVRSYLILDPDNNGWRQPLDCDPDEPTCEEF